MNEALVELVFMMVILKIPVAYLCLVVYWAVRAEPLPPEPALLPVEAPEPLPDGGRPRARHAPRPRRPGPRPRGAPTRTYARRARVARADVQV